MKRLTKDNDTQYDFIGKYDTNVDEFANNKELRNNVMNKLGHLEDIEEELGIDLITLFKAFRDGVYSNLTKEYHKIHTLKYNPICGGYYLLGKENGTEKNFRFKLSTYGITWALTKEELENVQ